MAATESSRRCAKHLATINSEEWNWLTESTDLPAIARLPRAEPLPLAVSTLPSVNYGRFARR